MTPEREKQLVAEIDRLRIKLDAIVKQMKSAADWVRAYGERATGMESNPSWFVFPEELGSLACDMNDSISEAEK